MCCKEGDIEYLKVLFNKSVDFNQSDYDGRTPLHIAVSENREDIVKFLINIAKVNINKKDRWGRIAKDETNNQEILKYLE